MRYVPATGPSRARIVCVGEAPGEVEEREGKNFCGPSGGYLKSLLRNAGINPDEVLYLNVSRFRPPYNDITAFIKKIPKTVPRGPEADEPCIVYKSKLVVNHILVHVRELFQDIANAKPRVVIALGRTALWSLTGQDLSIDQWKGSVIPTTINGHRTLIIPIQHPAYLLRMYKDRFHSEQYFRKASYYLTHDYTPPKENFITRPSFQQVMDWFINISLSQDNLFCDIETIDRRHIECIGFCTEFENVICIPFIEDGKDYWPEHEEKEIIDNLRSVLTKHHITGQNFFYDAQYVFNSWLCTPNLVWDTMLAHHTLFPSTEKSLDYQSSIYLDNHKYWKRSAQGDRWEYNCRDCLQTKRIHDVQQELAEQAGQMDQIKEQTALYHPVLKMMLRGVNRDTDETALLKAQVDRNLAELDNEIQTICGYPLNVQSPKQLKDLFYNQLQQKPITTRKKISKRIISEKDYLFTQSRETTGDDALDLIAKREPALLPLTTLVNTRRSIKTIAGTTVEAKSDLDGRLRTSLNIAGTRTFRFASSKAVNGNGLNIQNIKRMDDDQSKERYPKPQVRRMFIPDPGYTIIDADLKNAEFYVMVWDSGDPIFKQMLQENVDIHEENGKLLKVDRQMAKGFIYATNYLATPRTCAIQFGMTTNSAERYQQRYFSAHPHIKDWHSRILSTLSKTGTVTNPFGYRITYYDRLESVSAEAVDWIPQSTVAIITDRGILNIEKNLPSVQMLFQNHDSIIAQVRTEMVQEMIPLVTQNMLIPVPYNDPLVIPVDVKTSEKSWGEVEKWQRSESTTT